MRALVTGAAGFIGSHLSERLLELGHEVVGVDCFTDYYAAELKRRNVERLVQEPAFRLVEQDLGLIDLDRLLDGVQLVFHQAAQPGVRASWDRFDSYVQQNVMVTQRLLEASRTAGSVRRFVYASSSSVYGEAASYPTRESDRLSPHSPYGVTKLAGEHLVSLYGKNFALPTVSLRYHTVYGERQRPDMATHRLIEAALSGSAFPMYGAGDHVRDFTYVGDIVSANVLAAERGVDAGTVLNIAGGGSTSMASLVSLVEELSGRPIRLEQLPPQAGDVRRTGGSAQAAQNLLGWLPQTSVRDGVAAQLLWHQSLRSLA